MTPYTYDLSKIKLATVGRGKTTQDSSDTISVESAEGKLIIGVFPCQCPFQASAGLACQHILIERQLIGEDLYKSSVAPNR